MKKLFKTVFVMIVVGLIIGAVASMKAKKRLEAMSDDEIRDYLATKLDGKVGEEQLVAIQDATIAGIRKAGRGAVGETAPDAENAQDAAENAG